MKDSVQLQNFLNNTWNLHLQGSPTSGVIFPNIGADKECITVLLNGNYRSSTYERTVGASVWKEIPYIHDAV